LLGEQELEGEFEGAHFLENEMESHESHFAQHEALAEQMANYAAQAESELEAEAMVGAATANVLTARDRAALAGVMRDLTRGAAVLTRILRRQRATRPLVRTVPTIMRGTARTLARRAAAGRPVNRRIAGQVMGNQVRRVIGSPRTCAHALRRNVRGSQAIARSTRRQAARESNFL
jgi:hypothetical protein